MEITSLSQLDIANGVYTYADYLTWKFDQTVELFKGKILQMSAPSRRNQGISTELSATVHQQFKRHPCKAYAALLMFVCLIKPNQQRLIKIFIQLFNLIFVLSVTLKN